MEELERLMFRSACWGDQAIADDVKAQVWIVSLLGWLSWLGHGLGDQAMADKFKAQHSCVGLSQPAWLARPWRTTE